MLRPNKMKPPGWTFRNISALAESSSFPGTPHKINWPSESALMILNNR